MSRLFNQHKRVSFLRQMKSGGEAIIDEKASSMGPIVQNKREDVISMKDEILNERRFPIVRTIFALTIGIVCLVALVLASHALTQAQKNDELLITAKEFIGTQKIRIDKLEKVVADQNTLQQSQIEALAQKIDVVNRSMGDTLKALGDLSVSSVGNDATLKDIASQIAGLNSAIIDMKASLTNVTQQLDAALTVPVEPNKIVP